MPELPEVETLCRQLNTVLPGITIRDVRVMDPRLKDPGLCTGLVIRSVSRKGKHVRMVLQGEDGLGKGIGKRTGGGVLEVLLHLRMTGRLFWLTEEIPLPAYTRMVFSFDAGKLLLIDPRRFATFAVRPLVEGDAPAMDPLEGMSAEALHRQAGARRLSVKAFLMDQRFVAGIGNIYACEILHLAGIDPRRPAGALRKPEWGKVAASARTVLLRAIACRGTSISDWRDLFGEPGENQSNLRVYSREGRSCQNQNCGGAIMKTILNGRGAWYCPVCQT